MADSLTKFCLIAIYLSEWGLSRVRSTTLALDDSQADRYNPDSRMILYEINQNQKEKR
ncbi:hypothetical protein [Emergencia sp. 1XD21-10]|uniref:hypothetical protein n=1 Tax=Emergencia sp. 1XD21-10 TaxID=2304569 RepID=UPI00137A464B|nr:hypothetical protein [Emergencia sp. 1XD21-10]